MDGLRARGVQLHRYSRSFFPGTPWEVRFHRGKKHTGYCSAALQVFPAGNFSRVPKIGLGTCHWTLDAVNSSDEIMETTSAEQASQLRRAGWVVLYIGKAIDPAGEACLKFVLARKVAGNVTPHLQSPSENRQGPRT